MKILEDFKSREPPLKRVSKLNKFQNEVIELYGLDYTVEQIQDFLNSQKIKISTRRIYQFIKSKKNLSNQNFPLQTPDRIAVAKKSDEQEDEINLQNLRNILKNQG